MAWVLLEAPVATLRRGRALVVSFPWIANGFWVDSAAATEGACPVVLPHMFTQKAHMSQHKKNKKGQSAAL